MPPRRTNHGFRLPQSRTGSSSDEFRAFSGRGRRLDGPSDAVDEVVPPGQQTPPAVVEIDDAVDMIGDEDDGGIHAATFVLRVGHLSVVASSWLQLLYQRTARPSSFFGN